MAATRYTAQRDDMREWVVEHFINKLEKMQSADGLRDYLMHSTDRDLAMRDVLTMAVKAGTDALKTDTDAGTYSAVIDAFEAAEARCRKKNPNWVRVVPYTKTTAYQLRDDLFSGEDTLRALAHNPTLAAGVMEVNIEQLQSTAYWRKLPGISRAQIR